MFRTKCTRIFPCLSLLVLIAITCSCNKIYAEDGALVGQSAMANLVGKLEPLVLRYYPKAKIKKTASSFHFEFKTKPYDIPQTDTIELGPDWKGILGDLSLKSGHLSEEQTVEKKLNQYSYYSVMELRPNSPTQDCHLESRLCYPFDVQPDFLQSFKQLCRAFDKDASNSAPSGANP